MTQPLKRDENGLIRVKSLRLSQPMDAIQGRAAAKGAGGAAVKGERRENGFAVSRGVPLIYGDLIRKDFCLFIGALDSHILNC